jgi:hypothetical protein
VSWPPIQHACVSIPMFLWDPVWSDGAANLALVLRQTPMTEIAVSFCHRAGSGSPIPPGASYVVPR